MSLINDNGHIDTRDINPAHKDAINQGVDGTKLVPQPTFVDQNIIAEFRTLIRQAADIIILAASVFIGNSDPVK